MFVRVGQNGFSTSVSHKVYDFSFPVVLYTFPGSNVPIKMGYNVFSSQILRFTRICSVKNDFVERPEKVFPIMLNIMLNRGYLADCLIRSCENVFRLRHHLLLKIGWFSCEQVPFAFEIIIMN